MHDDIIWCLNTDPDLVATDLYDGYRDRVTDDNLFPSFST